MGTGFHFCFSGSPLTSGQISHLSPHKADTASLRDLGDTLQFSHIAPVAQNHLVPERPQQ